MSLENNKSNIREFFVNLTARAIKDDFLMIASSLSYYLIFATIPLLIVLMNITSFLLNGYSEVIFKIVELMPPNSKEITLVLLKVVEQTSSSLGLSLGIFFSIWSASTGINRLITSINIAYGLRRKRKIIQQRIVSILYTLGFFIIILFVLTFEVFNNQILKIINTILNTIDNSIAYSQVEEIWNLFNGFLPFIILFIAFTFFYKLAPQTTRASRVKLTEAMLGAAFTSFFIILISVIYSFFINNISRMSLVYGTLAGFMAMFFWIFLVSNIIVIGALVIASYREVFKNKYFTTRPIK
ncbi:MAG: YihY/virulence factor BrkB family protein [Tissierellia bacterium]|nr:YihY/virulence factor BrkB family protein [Tissierellia bacterium]